MTWAWEILHLLSGLSNREMRKNRKGKRNNTGYRRSKETKKNKQEELFSKILFGLCPWKESFPSDLEKTLYQSIFTVETTNKRA